MSDHILQFFATLNSGGAENRMMDVYRCINPEVVTFDFAVVHEEKHFFDDEIAKMKSKKYVLPDPRQGMIKNYYALKKFFKAHPEFKAVHAHVAWYNGVVLLAAKSAGIKVRIAHARDAAIPKMSVAERLKRFIGKVLIKISSTQNIAISPEAAENIFGKSAVKRNRYIFVPNSIDQKKYVVYNSAQKAELRKKLKIPQDKKAYVTVANLRRPKNHMFLLDIADELRKRNDNFVLYLIGEGDLRTPIEEKIKELKLEKHVKLLGTRGDVPQILGAFDCMIFPSFYEGLGGVVLESQLVGVPAVVSTGIPSVADVGVNMVDYVPLEDGKEKWAEKIIYKSEHFEWDYNKTMKAFKDKGYCIEDTARRYLEEYGLDKSTVEKALSK